MFRSVFAAPLYPLRPIIYTPPPFPAHAEDLIGSGVRKRRPSWIRNSQEFEGVQKNRSNWIRSSQDFARVWKTSSDWIRSSQEFAGGCEVVVTVLVVVAAEGAKCA